MEQPAGRVGRALPGVWPPRRRHRDHGPIVVTSRNANDLPSGILFFSERSETAVFGDSTSRLVRENSALATLRQLMMYWLMGLFLSFGLLQLALAWFGLRAGHTWALRALTLGIYSFRGWHRALTGERAATEFSILASLAGKPHPRQ